MSIYSNNITYTRDALRVAILAEVSHTEVNIRELYYSYLSCKGEIDILVCKRCPPIYDLNLKVNLLEKRLDSPDIYNYNLSILR